MLKDSRVWNQLCSSLDVIGDTELAIDAYLKTIKAQNDGEKYLIVYGILQALFLQQDAITNLSESLSLEFEPDPLLQEIRTIRNDSVGHPTKRGRGKGKNWNFISRVSLSQYGFTLQITTKDYEEHHHKNINIPQLIKNQRNQLSHILSKIIERLQKEEMDHKEKFKDQKLVDIFPQTMGYYFRKISESINNDHLAPLGKMHVDLVKDIFNNFKVALKEREIIPANDFIKYELNLLEHPFKVLEQYFDESNENSLLPEDASIYLYFVTGHLKKLQELAMEIDEEFKSS